MSSSIEFMYSESTVRIMLRDAKAEGAREEREACAKICEKVADSWALPDERATIGMTAADCARNIRARGEEGGKK